MPTLAKAFAADPTAAISASQKMQARTIMMRIVLNDYLLQKIEKE